jgi:hypothetical protein
MLMLMRQSASHTQLVDTSGQNPRPTSQRRSQRSQGCFCMHAPEQGRRANKRRVRRGICCISRVDEAFCEAGTSSDRVIIGRKERIDVAPPRSSAALLFHKGE